MQCLHRAHNLQVGSLLWPPLWWQNPCETWKLNPQALAVPPPWRGLPHCPHRVTCFRGICKVRGFHHSWSDLCLFPHNFSFHSRLWGLVWLCHALDIIYQQVVMLKNTSKLSILRHILVSHSGGKTECTFCGAITKGCHVYRQRGQNVEKRSVVEC